MAQKSASTKKKSATTTPNSSLIVFGALEGKQRAGTFPEADVALAKKAAAELGLSTIDVTDPATKELAAKLRTGNIHANANGILSVAPKAVYSLLTGGTAGSNREARRPKNWDDIAIGDIVVSQDTDPEEGWWAARTIQVKGDLLTLQWLTRSDKRSFKKHKLNVALLWPGEDLPATAHVDSVTKSSAYPTSWKTIDVGSLVVVPEIGPLRQFWNAKVIEVIGENTLKLEWDGYPDAPHCEHDRINVGLIYPIPRAPAKRRKAV